MSPQGFSRLEQLIRDDERARQHFIEFVHDSFSLRTWAESKAEPAIEGCSNGTVHEPAGSSKAFDGASHAPGKGRREQPLLNGAESEDMALLKHFGCSWRWRLGPRRWVAVAIAVAIAVGWITLLLPKVRREAPIVTGRPPALATPKGRTVDGFAVVVQVAGVMWERVGERELAEGDILSAGRLAFRSGRATLTFLNGVTLVAEGPADLDLVSVDRVFCRRGKLRAKVPPGAEGFVISAPDVAIVDHGTEFAVNVDSDGKAQVLVLKGKVQSALLDEEGTPRREQFIEERKSFSLNPRTDRIEECEARSDGFAGPASLVSPSLILGEDYSKAVIQSRPWGYWRFESMADGATPNEIRGGPPLRVTGPVRIAGKADGNGCVAFASRDSWQVLSLDELWDPPRDPGHAVELWVLPGSGPARHSGSPAPPTEPGDFRHLLLLELTDTETAVPPQAGRRSLPAPLAPGGGRRAECLLAGNLRALSMAPYRRPEEWRTDGALCGWVADPTDADGKLSLNDALPSCGGSTDGVARLPESSLRRPR